MSRFSVRYFFSAGLALSGLLVLTSSPAQDFPNRPVTIVAAGAPGLPVDIVARLLAPAMAQSLGQAVVVENKLGAGSLIGYEYAAKRPPDGYTIASVSVVQLASLPVAVKSLRFDPLKDLPPFIGVAEGKVFLCATTNVPWKTFKEMVVYAKANPGKVNFGVSAPNTVLLAHALLRDLAVDGVQVPYSSANPLILDLIAGNVHMAFIGESAVPPIASRLRIIATSGARRSPQFPDVPTFTELGISNQPGLGYSFNAPAGTPRDVVTKLNRAVAFALDQPDNKARLAQMQLEVTNVGGDAANKDFLQQAKVFSDVAARVGYVPQ